jgi:hypothetical protein
MSWNNLDHQKSFDNLVETILILADIDAQHAIQLAAIYGQLDPVKRNMFSTLENFLKEKGCKIRSEAFKHG